MTLGIVGLLAAYVLLAILLLSVNLYSQWSWWVKSIAIVITSIFYAVSYFSFPHLLGWPTQQELPKHFRLLSSEVQQPDKLTGADGVIYLWLKEVKDITKRNSPRAYELAYSEWLHERVIRAQAKIDRGVPQLGEYEEDVDALRTPVNTSETGQESLDIQFYDLPDPLLPAK